MPSLPCRIQHLQLVGARAQKLPKSSLKKAHRRIEAPWRLEAPRLKVPRLPFPLHPLSILKSSPQCSSRALLFFTPKLCTRPLKKWATCLKNDCRLLNALANTTSLPLLTCKSLPRSLQIASLFSTSRSFSALYLQFSPIFIPCSRAMLRRATSLSSGYFLYFAPRGTRLYAQSESRASSPAASDAFELIGLSPSSSPAGRNVQNAQLIASKFAKASACTKPPPTDTSAVGARPPLTLAPNAPGSQLPPTSESKASGAQAPPLASAATSGAARQQTPTFSRARVPKHSASSTGGNQGYSANALAASGLASMPSDPNLQKPGCDDEPFAPKKATAFEQSAYSDVLDRGLADIRTPVMTPAECFAQHEAPRKQSAETAVKHKHQHSKKKRACRNSPIKSKGQLPLHPSPPKTPPRRQHGVLLQPAGAYSQHTTSQRCRTSRRFAPCNSRGTHSA